MSDEFLPPGSLPWSESWPYWMPNTLLGMLPPLALPRVPGDQFGGHGLQQSFGANGEAASLLNDPKGENALAWLAQRYRCARAAEFSDLSRSRLQQSGSTVSGSAQVQRGN